jgi:hypothetical protein
LADDVMADILYREFTLTSKSVWVNLIALLKANAQAFIERNTPLRIIVTNDAKPRSTEQNARYWALLTTVADNAWINGQRFSKEVWHEHYARLYLPLNEVILPSGEIVLVRSTTTRLKVPEFANYMTQIEANAVTELGVEFGTA